MRDISEDLFEEMTEEVGSYKVVEPPHVIDTSRWSVLLEAVVYEAETDKYWRLNWSRGATEYQDEDFECHAVEVKPVEKTVIKYEKI